MGSQSAERSFSGLAAVEQSEGNALVPIFMGAAVLMVRKASELEVFAQVLPNPMHRTALAHLVRIFFEWNCQKCSLESLPHALRSICGSG